MENYKTVFGIRETDAFKAARIEAVQELKNRSAEGQPVTKPYENAGFGESSMSFELNKAGDKLIGTDNRTGDVSRWDTTSQRLTSHEINRPQWEMTYGLAAALEKYPGTFRDIERTQDGGIQHGGRTFKIEGERDGFKWTTPEREKKLVCEIFVAGETAEIAKVDALLVDQARNLLNTQKQEQTQQAKPRTVVEGLRTKEPGYVWTNKNNGDKYQLDGDQLVKTTPEGKVSRMNADAAHELHKAALDKKDALKLEQQPRALEELKARLNERREQTTEALKASMSAHRSTLASQPAEGQQQSQQKAVAR